MKNEEVPDLVFQGGTQVKVSFPKYSWAQALFVENVSQDVIRERDKVPVIERACIADLCCLQYYSIGGGFERAVFERVWILGTDR